VVDATLTGFVVNVKVLEIVVEIDRASTQVATKEGGVGSEHGGDVNVPFSTERDSETSLPFVKVRDDGLVELARNVLGTKRRVRDT